MRSSSEWLSEIDHGRRALSIHRRQWSSWRQRRCSSLEPKRWRRL